MLDPSLLIEQIFNGLQYGTLLFMMAAGLTLVFGVVNFINLAHGTQFMLGAYFSATIGNLTGSFVAGIAASILGVLLVGLILEKAIFRHLYRADHLDQVLCTFGIVLFFNELVKVIWGAEPLNASLPEMLRGQTAFFGAAIPFYRMLIVVVGVSTAGILFFVISFTKLGMLMRAAASNPEMLSLLAVDPGRVSRIIFCFGAVLAGLAGAIAAPLFSVSPGMGDDMVIVAFAVVIIGGLGSIQGAFCGAMLIGMVDTIGRAYGKNVLSTLFSASTTAGLAPAISSTLVFCLVALVLLLLPQGLLPPKGIRRAGHAQALSLRSNTSSHAIGNLSQPTIIFLLVGLLLLPVLALAFGNTFLLELVSRFIIMSMAALSLGFILSFGGLVSLGHALYLGIGAYAVGISFHYGGFNALTQWPIAICASAIIAIVVGGLSLRTSGSFFIMITLAFSQMFYFVAIGLSEYGGDDGMSLTKRSALPIIDLANPATFYVLCTALLLVQYMLMRRLVGSPFGLTLRGIKSNERKMKALGYEPGGYKLVAVVVSAASCGLAGALLANSTQFVGPHFMHWTRSGDLLTMVTLGGVGTFFGPIAGAFAFLGFEKLLADWTEHWPLLLGAILVLFTVGPTARSILPGFGARRLGAASTRRSRCFERIS